MRLPSLVAGICLLPLVWLLGRRLFSRRTATVALALVAVSPGLIRYSVELKQYSVDAAVAVALVLLGVVVDERPSTRGYAQLGVAGVLAVWLSHPAVLVLAGIGLVLLVRRFRARDHRGVVLLGALGLTWVVSLALLYVVSLRDLTENEFLTGYWRAGFPDSLRPDRVLAWAWSSTVDLLAGLGGFDLAAAAAVGVLAACAAVVARGETHRIVPLFVFVPALVLAAAVEQYPYRGRLALFTLPLLLLALASLVEVRGAVPRSVAGALLVVVAAGPVLQSAEDVVDPFRFPEARAVIEYVADHARPGDRILVHGLAAAPFGVYGPREGLTAHSRLAWRPRSACEGAPGLADVHGTVWVVFAYTHSAAPPDEAAILRTHLAAAGHRLDLVERHDAFGARYDLDAPPDDPTGSSVRTTPTTGCLRVFGG